MYQVASSKAEEFIHDGEIVETLAYARENRANRPLIEAILQKAAEGKGVTHREAAVLLECELEDLNQRMFTLAKQIKEKIYGNRIVMFAPLYLSNYCINGCVYCPYHQKNKTIPRRKLTQEEIRREVIAKRNFKFKMDVHVFCYSYCLWNYYLHDYNWYLELICCIIYNKLNSYIIIYSIKNIY